VTAVPHDPTDTSWLLDAACRGCDSNIFFTSRGENKALAKAKAICARCPVTQECLEYALSQPFTCQGVYGGTSERERRRIRLRNNKLARQQEMQGHTIP
jgi:WhiB family redox-sensing transcriptional regulator